MTKQVWPWGILLACALLLAACGSPAPERNPRVKGSAKNTDGYAEISMDQLASLVDGNDFALVNVHTPCEGKISQTDLFIPFD